MSKDGHAVALITGESSIEQRVAVLNRYSMAIGVECMSTPPSLYVITTYVCNVAASLLLLGYGVLLPLVVTSALLFYMCMSEEG